MKRAAPGRRTAALTCWCIKYTIWRVGTPYKPSPDLFLAPLFRGAGPFWQLSRHRLNSPMGLIRRAQASLGNARREGLSVWGWDPAHHISRLTVIV